MLTRHEAKPGCEVASILELRAIPDRGHESGCRLGAYTFDLCDPLARVIAAEHAFNLLVELSNAPVQVAEQVMEFADRLTSEVCEFVVHIGQDGGDGTTSAGDADADRNPPIE